MHAIVELELKNLSARLQAKEIFFELNDPAKSFIIEKGYDDKLGARPLKRAIERYLEDSLAEAILDGSIKPGGHISVELNDNGTALCFSQAGLTSKTKH